MESGRAWPYIEHCHPYAATSPQFVRDGSKKNKACSATTSPLGIYQPFAVGSDWTEAITKAIAMFMVADMRLPYSAEGNKGFR